MQIQSALLDNYTIGFESLFNDLETIRLQFTGNYPPHNITKIDSSTFKLSLAVAGFAKEELSITETDGLLSIKGAKKGDKNSKFLYHGIAFSFGCNNCLSIAPFGNICIMPTKKNLWDFLSVNFSWPRVMRVIK